MKITSDKPVTSFEPIQLTIILESPEELEALYQVFGSVCGDRRNSPAAATQLLYAHLEPLVKRHFGRDKYASPVEMPDKSKWSLTGEMCWKRSK